jgi:hypothetical protein
VKGVLNKIRYRIAVYLDERHPEMCWAKLVMWSLGYASYKETFVEGGCKNQLCRGKNPWDAYCGKCAKTGRLYLLPKQDSAK